MPFLFLKTNAAISPEQEVRLKTAFGKAIALVPNKSEAVLMMELQDNARMWLRGGQPPMAFNQVEFVRQPTTFGLP